MNALRIILLFGLPGALIVGAPMVWGMLTQDATSPVGQNGVIIGYATMLVALTGIFLGVKHYRDKERGGVIKFLPALGVGLGIGTVATLGWVIAWEVALAVTKFDFIGTYFGTMIEDARAAGQSAEYIAKLEADKASFAAMYANPVTRMLITFGEMFWLAIVIAVLSALLLRNSRFLPARAAA